jgi:Protein of unknown function (DUF1573)
VVFIALTNYKCLFSVLGIKFVIHSISLKVFDMKKVFIFALVGIMACGATFAQDKKTISATAPATETKATTLKPENMVFKTEVHDFGTIPEGPAAEYEFQFSNNGTEPIVIQRAQASCGCTTPHYSKDPVLPGKDGALTASYNTNGRPGPFTKTITIVSNAGTKVVTIKGTVEKAPTSSVPENNSIIKTN